jgi:signal recognition particle subunit SRP54
VAKLGKLLRERDKKRVMVVSADVYRPAAIEQLRTLAAQVEIDFVESHAGEKPVDIARRAVQEAKDKLADVLIVDTAGRLAIDADMMAEIQAIHAAIQPIETLFVVDAMTGQDAAVTAKAFNEALPLTGVVLAKADGDARGGAALSVRTVTGKPIKFLGIGEKVDGLEPFHPDRIASRILGMGDVLGLIEDAGRKLDRDKADKLAQKLSKGKRFDLNDLRDQLQQMRNMGGVAALLDKLPGMGQMQLPTDAGVDEKSLKRMEAIICSMTPKERKYPDLLNGSRKRRIAAGSGTDVADINRLLKQHKTMEKVMKKMTSKGGMMSLMRGLGQAAKPGFRGMR